MVYTAWGSVAPGVLGLALAVGLVRHRHRDCISNATSPAGSGTGARGAGARRVQVRRRHETPRRRCGRRQGGYRR